MNPKNLLVCVAVGATIAAASLSGTRATWSVVVFTLTAASTVAVPVLAYAVGRRRMAGPLESLRRGLTAHSYTSAAERSANPERRRLRRLMDGAAHSLSERRPR